MRGKLLLLCDGFFAGVNVHIQLQTTSMRINKLCFDSANTTKIDLALSLSVTPPRGADVPCMVPEAPLQISIAACCISSVGRQAWAYT